MGYREFRWLGIVVLAVGGVVVWLSVRGARWYPGALPWIGILVGLVALLVGAALAYVGTTELPLIRQADRPTREELRRPAPSFDFPLVGSAEERSLGGYRGRVVLLNLWATWCAASLEERPVLDRLQERYREEGLVVITLSLEPPDHLARFAEDDSFDTVNGWIPDRDGLPHPFRRAFRTMPTSYLIDRDGYIRRFVLGSRTYEEWERKVLGVLSVESRAPRSS